MYITKAPNRSRMQSVETTEGETLEQKLKRIVHNQEPIDDSAPLLYTERKEGVVSAYNIRTDRWELAVEAMDVVAGSIDAKREAKYAADKNDSRANDAPDSTGDNVGKAESTDGQKGAE